MVFFLGQALDTSGDDILDSVDALRDRCVQRGGRQDALHKPASQIEPFFGRQFKGHTGQFCRTHA